MKLRLSLVFFIFISISLLSDKNTRFDQLSVKEGLSQSTVNSIVQDHEGFLWFGTMNGLNRFDGYNMKVYYNDLDDQKSLSHNYILTLFVDSQGVLWVGTDGGGLCRYNMKTDDFTCFRHNSDDPNSISNNWILKIYEDSSNKMWIGTSNGLNKFDKRTNQFKVYWNKSGKEDLSCNVIRDIIEDKSESLLIGTKVGVYEFNLIKNDFDSNKYLLNSDTSTPPTQIRMLVESQPGTFWVGIDSLDKESGGLYLLDTKNKKIHMKRLFPNIKRVWTVLKASDKKIWVGSRGGGLFKIEGKKRTHYQVDFNFPESIKSNRIRSVFEDRSGIIWIGTVGAGVQKIDPEKGKFSSAILFPKSDTYLTAAFSRENSGTIWVGTNKGILKYVQKGEEILPIDNKLIKTEDIFGSVSSIYEDHKGILWVGTVDEGVFCYDPRPKTFVHFRNAKEEPSSLSHNYINVVYEDSLGVIWIGTQGGGLNRFEREKKVFIRLPGRNNGLADSSVKSIYEDRKGRLWIGTRNGGLNLYNRKTDSFTAYRHQISDKNSLSHNFVNCIMESESGTLWVGTDGGLNKLISGKQFIRYTKKNGIASNIIHGILEDGNNKLWLSTDKGISRFCPKEEKVKNFSIDDGLLTNVYRQMANFKSKEGKMFFGGKKGFNFFYAEDIKNNPYIPPVKLVGIKKYYKDIDLKKNISEIKLLQLDYKESTISFEFSALNYSNPSKNQYSYFLEGLDNQWIDLGTRRDITFTNLDPGSYMLKVRGSNNDGVWNNEGFELKLIITPPFWKTWWFTILSAVIIICLSYLLVMILKKHLKLIAFWKHNHYIAHYKILDKIASGGMGIVYKSVSLLDKKRFVAIKLIREEYIQNQEQRKRFMNEAAIIDKLNHKNIVNVIERGERHKQLFLVMEYLKGELLSEKIKKDQKVSLIDFLKIAGQLISAIVVIHQSDVIHRDLKPENIMLVNENGSGDVVKILDFGLAKTRSLTQLTESGIIMGTINYISPEQISGLATEASDIYSLGVIFYEMLTGEKPFLAETSIDIINQILKVEPIDPIKFNWRIPEQINDMIMSMLSKSPESRPTPNTILKILETF